MLYNCSYRTFGMESDPEYKADPIPFEDVGYIDPEYTEFSYRMMKGVVAVAVIESPVLPTLREFMAIMNQRIGSKMQEVLEGRE